MSRTPILLVLLGLAAIAAAIGLNEFAWREEITAKEPEAASEEQPKSAETDTAQPKPERQAGASPEPASDPDAARAPSFDVIRVNPEGDTVIAGNAPLANKMMLNKMMPDTEPVQSGRRK